MKVFRTKIKSTTPWLPIGFSTTNIKKTTVYFFITIRMVTIGRDSITNVPVPVTIISYFPTHNFT
jgi:hypothetical protein